MALLATRAKLTIVRIIPPMAVETTTSRFSNGLPRWCFLRVTRITLDAHMSSYQRISGLLIVIELPGLPVPGVVATFAPSP